VTARGVPTIAATATVTPPFVLHREDVNFLGVPLAKMCTEVFAESRERILMKNIVYVGILVALLAIDMDVVVKILDEKFKGVVTEIANSAANTGTGNQVVLTSDQVTNFVVKIRILPESYESLLEFTGNIPFRPGMSATVDIYTKTVTDVLSVPIASVTTRDEKDEKENAEEEKTEEMEEAEEKKKKEEEIKEVVFVFEADTARMTVVKTGIQDNEYIEILSGLSEGEEVVSGPYSAISRTIDAGDRLRIKEKKKD